MNQPSVKVAQRRKGLSPINMLLLVFSVVSGGLVIYFAGYPFEAPMRFCIIFLGLSAVIIALSSLKEKPIYPILSGKWNYAVVGLFVAVAIAVTVYFYQQLPFLMYERAGVKALPDYIMGALAILLILETTRIRMGKVIPATIVVFWLYAYFGPYFPGGLRHTGLSLSRILEISGPEVDAIYGSLAQLAATAIAIFIFYPSLIRGFGGMDLILRGARWLAQRSGYLICQTAVLGSLVFGMFSGSAAANAAGVGGFTIPLMKKYGVPPDFAGAVEAVASSGGQVMPPILGAAVFIMMDYLRMSYLQIMLISFVPAIIFYGMVALAVHLKSMKYVSETSVVAMDTQQSGPAQVRKVSAYGLIPIFISMVVLFVLLAYFKLGVLITAYYMIVSLLASQLVLELVMARGKPATLLVFGKELLDGLKEGATTGATIAVLAGSMGIIMKVLVATAISQKLAFLMVDLSGGHLWILLPLVMMVSIAFGMAMATVAVYILVAMLAAPALQTLGVTPLVAHFTVFWFSISAGITPPVAPVCGVTTTIARGNYMRTCWEACKLGLPMFLLPYIFVLYPGLLSLDIAETPKAFMLTLMGMGGITAAIFLVSPGFRGALKRIAYLVLGVLVLFHPGLTVTLIATILIAAMAAFEVRGPFKRLLLRTGKPRTSEKAAG